MIRLLNLQKIREVSQSFRYIMRDKPICGNKIIFEEINEDLDLNFKYQWTSSDRVSDLKLI